jgi:hypothetical protein
MFTTPPAILDVAFQQAEASIGQSIVSSQAIAEKIDYVCRYVGNRAVVRLLLACSLAAIHRSDIDIRKPYTEINTPDSYSGRYYDENFITALFAFISPFAIAVFRGLSTVSISRTRKCCQPTFKGSFSGTEAGCPECKRVLVSPPR